MCLGLVPAVPGTASCPVFYASGKNELKGHTLRMDITVILP